MIDNYFTYYTEIEEYFVRKRKKNLLISPLDWCLIEIWKENRIPLHIVFRGIDRSFESAAGKGKKPPTTLYYCLPAVMEAFTEYQEALVGKADAGEESAASPEEPSSREIAHYLEGLRDTVEGLRRVDLPEDPLRTAVRRLADLEEEVVSSAGLRPGDIDRELDAISADLADALYGILSEEEQHRFQVDLKEELKIYRKRLSRKMFARLSEKSRVKMLFEKFGLPDFSLLNAGF